jgi:UDP-glucose 4-epimerase
MRALVTGGAGFIGSNIVDELVGRGDDVVVFDNLSTGRLSNLEGALAGGARLVEGDITNAEDLARAFGEAEPEVVMHLAAQIDVRHSVADPAYDLNVNVAGTVSVLERSRLADVRHVIFASTGGAIYGEGAGRDLPLDESAECRPDAPYGQSKFAAEGYVGLYSRLHGLPGVSLRLGNVYGPRQDPLGEAGVVAIFCGALLANETPCVYGDGLQTRDYIYVGDVVSAFLAAAGSSVTGTFNVGTAKETNVLELGAMVAAAAEVEFLPEMAQARVGEVQRITIDSSLAGREIDWRPEVGLEEGIKRTLDWTRAEG